MPVFKRTKKTAQPRQDRQKMTDAQIIAKMKSNTKKNIKK